jgi:carbon monoxide dehydrogenase subunit G
MASVAKSAEVSASPDQVWATVSDLEKAGDWLAVHDSYPEGVPEEITEGTSYKQKVKIMGMPGEVTWTVTEIDHGVKLSMTGAGPMGTTLANTIIIEANGDGSKVTFETEFGGPALAAMEGPLTAASGKAAEDSLEKLKGLFN